MNPNSHFGELVDKFNSHRFVLNGGGQEILSLGHGATVPLESGHTKRGERYLRGSLCSPHLNPNTIIYARKLKVVVGNVGISAYFGRSGGFFIMGIPDGDHLVQMEFDRRREIRTTKQRHQAMLAYNRKQAKKKHFRELRRQTHAYPGGD